MNIVEALKTGKWISRKDHSFQTSDGSRLWMNMENNLSLERYPLDCDDLRADDWEAKPETRGRLKAWLGLCGTDDQVVYFTRFAEEPPTENSLWIRAPWLDEPE